MPGEADIYRLTMKGSQFGQAAWTGYTFIKNGLAADVEDLTTHWATNIVPLVVACETNTITWYTLSVVSVMPDGPEALEVAIPGTPSGTVASDPLPPFCSGLISIRTGLRGRRRHGRMYIPNMSELYHDDARMVGAGLAAMNTLGAALTSFYGLGGSFAASWGGVVYSPAAPEFTNRKDVHTRLTSLWTPTTNHVVDEVVRSTRSRAIGHGI